ncbi:TRM11 family SAM-dependent methyltransferase [Evansella cellulosilytica]|uniref:RNA methylase n=1 Tax=Evansella cellulosilytica (strain ATCC 21833 / DSM 2522 / FERM P-1141 / JCM 9156 / N-4) TaxID=649639 RepID=E6TQP8_EVAC2|nr:methyltransferase domain-containing protein [Evansella cellulosilytica]ADU30559.1 RNA methylase [Evansella cellulosilytica DSM 2522]
MINKNKKYYYFYSYTEEEYALCQLEMRTLFNYNSDSHILSSDINIDPSRSPFIKGKLEILCQESDIQSLTKTIAKIPSENSTFKVVYLKNKDSINSELSFIDRRKIEREVGLEIDGQASLHNPNMKYGLIRVEDCWVFGRYTESKPVWYYHQEKPYQYSTALNTRIARAITNIAVPVINSNLKVIDPCCGIGTVIIEALSMGINIEGCDINPLVPKNARENVMHFHYETNIVIQDMRKITKKYDVAIIDMPYNKCSVLTEKEKKEMLTSARLFTKKLVLITIEPIEHTFLETGFTVIDKCVVKKGSSFQREVFVCQ